MRLPKLYSTAGLFLTLTIIIILLIIKLQPSWQITGDGFGYYSYLRSLYFDHDLNFLNEYKYYDLTYHSHLADVKLTPANKLGNVFAIGLSIVWLPFFLLARLWGYWFASGSFQFPGLGLPYQITLGIGSILYTIGGLLLLFNILKKFFTARLAWIATLSIVFISPLLQYLIYEPHMSHGVSLASVILLFWLSLSLYQPKEKPTIKQLVWLGLSMGLTMLLRWQNVIFWILPLAILYQVFKNKKLNWFFVFLPLLIATISFIPQLVVWKNLYGSFLIIPQGSSFLHWTNPHLFQFLFSGFHGLFFWHPLLFLGIIGLFLSYQKNHSVFWILFLMLILQIYINSTVNDWWAGQSFGSRRMIETLPIFAYGLVYLLQNIKRKWLFNSLLGLLLLGGFFNILIMISAPRGFLPLEKPVTAKQYYLAPLQMFKDKLQ